MDATISYFAVGLIALLLGAFFARQSKNTLADQWDRAFALAQELVPAIEQLYLTEKISKDQRLDAVMAELRAAGLTGLTEKQLQMAVEGAVHFMNQGKLMPIIAEPLEQISDWTLFGRKEAN